MSMRKHDATYFGYIRKDSRLARLASLVLLLGWLAILQGSSQAQTQRQNYNAVGGVTAGVGVMTAIGGGICALATPATGCAPIAAAGVILFGIGGTMGAMNQATGASSQGAGPLPDDMPDSDVDCGIECGDEYYTFDGGSSSTADYGLRTWQQPD